MRRSATSNRWAFSNSGHRTSAATLVRRVAYGGRKGRAARRRLLRMTLSELEADGVRVSVLGPT
jgi:hypothetical protein